MPITCLFSGQRLQTRRLLHRWIGDAPINGGGIPLQTRRCHSAGSEWPGLMLRQGDPFHALWDPATRAMATARSDERPRSSSRRRKTRPRGLLFLLFRQCVRLTVSFSFSFSSLVVHPSKNSISKDSSSLEVSNNLSLASSPALESGKRQFHCKQTACGPYTFYLVAREC